MAATTYQDDDPQVRQQVLRRIQPQAQPDQPDAPAAPLVQQPASPLDPRQGGPGVGPAPFQPAQPANTPAIRAGEPNPNAPTPIASPAPLADWQSVQSGNLDRAWTDFAGMKYGGSNGFAAMPAGGLQRVVNEFNAATGANARMVPGLSGDLIDFGDGRGPVDVVTADGRLWNARLGGNNGDGGGAGGVGAGGSLGAGGGSTNSFLADLRARLIARMNKDTMPVDPNDAYIADPMNAARLEQDRSLEQARKDDAEAAYAQGDLSSNTLRDRAQQGRERSAGALATLRGNLVAQEYQSRRTDLNQALQQALASNDAEMARNIQMALAQLDDSFRRAQLGFQMSAFEQGQNTNTVNTGAGR